MKVKQIRHWGLIGQQAGQARHWRPKPHFSLARNKKAPVEPTFLALFTGFGTSGNGTIGHPHGCPPLRKTNFKLTGFKGW
jgi:hypothetical protein